MTKHEDALREAEARLVEARAALWAYWLGKAKPDEDDEQALTDVTSAAIEVGRLRALAPFSLDGAEKLSPEQIAFVASTMRESLCIMRAFTDYMLSNITLETNIMKARMDDDA